MMQVCIDLFLLAQGYVDVSTLSCLPMMTGGSIYHYCPFNPMMDQDQLLNDLKWNVSRPQVGAGYRSRGGLLGYARGSVSMTRLNAEQQGQKCEWCHMTHADRL